MALKLCTGTSNLLFVPTPQSNPKAVEYRPTGRGGWKVSVVATSDKDHALQVLERAERLRSASARRTIGDGDRGGENEAQAAGTEPHRADHTPGLASISASGWGPGHTHTPEQDARGATADDDDDDAAFVARSLNLLDAIVGGHGDIASDFADFMPPGMAILPRGSTLSLEMMLSAQMGEGGSGLVTASGDSRGASLSSAEDVPMEETLSSRSKAAKVVNPFLEYATLESFVDDGFGEEEEEEDGEEEGKEVGKDFAHDTTAADGALFQTEEDAMAQKGEMIAAPADMSAVSLAEHEQEQQQPSLPLAATFVPEYSDADLDVDSLLRLNLLQQNHHEQPQQQQQSKQHQHQHQRTSYAVTKQLDLDEFEALRPRMAMTFPFELDVFQKQAVLRLERRESVFVAAHTSAGKTVVAEYAVALAQRHKSRCIYTSPIKALSNQKYRDFKEKFEDVGIVTGDVSVNQEASCVIMTTEILRSMLYRGADAIRDIESVIFDEVHYVNDMERGVVWEEVIIMLPDNINLIFLSATSPNTVEFSEWIGRTKRRKVYIASTNKRPVPLQHYLYHDDEVYKIRQGEGPFDATAVTTAVRRQKERAKAKEMNADNKAMQAQRSRERQHNAAVAMGKAGGRGSGGGGGGGGLGGRGGGRGGPTSVAGRGGGGLRVGDISGSKSQWIALLNPLRQGGREAHRGKAAVDVGVGFGKNFLSAQARQEKKHMKKWESLPADLRQTMSKAEYEGAHTRADEDEIEIGSDGLLPVVIFSFSKKKCEEVADYFRGQDLLSAREKGDVGKVLSSALRHLSPLDQRLPQVLRMSDMLRRGVGVHHGGLLPLIKETVEILFARGVVKVLMATETFAMGVNMPARAVVFNGYRKHDGRTFRDLLPGEYTQMAGRAGRRGLDALGTVLITSWIDVPKEAELKKLLTGTPTRLQSQFRLTYNMILNLLRVNDLSVEDMIQRSFSEFHTQRAISSTDLLPKLRRCEAGASRARMKYSAMCDMPHISLPGGADTVRAYVEATVRARDLSTWQAVHVKNKGRPSDLKNLFCSGRRVWVLHETLASPVPGILLSEPNDGKESSTMGLSVAPEEASAQMAALRTMQLWVLVLLPPGQDPPAVPPTASGTVSGLPLPVRPSARALPPGFTAGKKGYGSTATAARPLPEWAPRSGRIPESTIGVTAGAGFLVMQASLTDIVYVSSPKKPGPIDCPTPSSGTTSGSSAGEKGSKMLHFGDLDLTPCLEALVLEGTGPETSPVDSAKVLRINDFDFVRRQMELSEAVQALACSPLHASPHSETLFSQAYKEWRLLRKIRYINHFMSSENLALFPDFQQRLAVLRHLGYVEGIAGSDVASLKGRVASEINTADELLTSEFILGNILEPLNPPEAAAMLSALVFQEKLAGGERELTPRMEEARVLMLAVQDNLLALQEALGVGVDGDVREGLNFGLAAATYEWARGVPFCDITVMTPAKEGTIVRAVTRLDELCKDVRNAARVIGNPSLYRKMEAASQCIKRDIAFAASLYI